MWRFESQLRSATVCTDPWYCSAKLKLTSFNCNDTKRKQHLLFLNCNCEQVTNYVLLTHYYSGRENQSQISFSFFLLWVKERWKTFMNQFTFSSNQIMFNFPALFSSWSRILALNCVNQMATWTVRNETQIKNKVELNQNNTLIHNRQSFEE